MVQFQTATGLADNPAVRSQLDAQPRLPSSDPTPARAAGQGLAP